MYWPGRIDYRYMRLAVFFMVLTELKTGLEFMHILYKHVLH